MRNSMIPKLAGLVFAAVLTASVATIWAADTGNVTGGYCPYQDMGPGMMGGGYGGMGMMGGGYGMGMLDLTADQQAKINKIFDDKRKQHWAIMGKMMEEQNKLRDLSNVDKPDPKKVGAVYGEIAKLQQQMIESHVLATNQMQDILTKEQRDQFRQWHRGGWGPGEGSRGPAGGQRGTMGPGNMPGNMMGR